MSNDPIRQGKSLDADGHLRVMAHLRIKGEPSTRPYRRMMDVPFDLYRRLPSVEQMYAENPEAVKRSERSEQWKRDGILVRRRVARKR